MSFIHLAAAMAAARKALERHCEKCGNREVSRASQIKDFIPCKKCGAEIPPKEQS